MERWCVEEVEGLLFLKILDLKGGGMMFVSWGCGYVLLGIVGIDSKFYLVLA
jgi:hypothetical protein